MPDTTEKLVFKTAAELSEAVAVHVHDWTRKPLVTQYETSELWAGSQHFLGHTLRVEEHDITKPAHWWMVVEEMRKNHEFHFRIQDECGYMRASFIQLHGWNGVAEMTADTEPGITISLAALRAVGQDCEWKPEDSDA